MHDNKILQALYSIFLGVLLALFVGVGISTFYPGPESPEFSAPMYGPSKEVAEEERLEQARYETEWKEFEEESEAYSRNVSIISLVSAVLFIVTGILLEKRIKMLASGVLLGGIFTLLYSIGRGFAADDSRYVFVV